MSRARGPRWTVLVPVKQLAVAKTRLTGYAGARREDLALAFATDTVRAALSARLVGAVVVVTDDARVAAAVAALGAQVIPDAPRAGLNPALLHGAREAARSLPRGPVAAVSADLPALQPASLDHVLAAATGPRAVFVTDAEGTGTTVVAAAYPDAFTPAFGHRSAAAHRAEGMLELLDGPLACVRRDVDTEVDLYDAVRLGVGPHTTLVLGGLGGPRARGSLPLVQATVRGYDPQQRCGTVLLDDGTELPYDAAAFDAGGLRLARVGQRVRIRLDAAATKVTFLTLATLPDPGSPAPNQPT
jgi:2-phospho-L-lactate guanylyltransferase